jgi:hypothetical protein
MKRALKAIPIMLFLSGLITGMTLYTKSADAEPKYSSTNKYVVLGWNNLGMHCYDPDFSNLAILPPYNNLVAQVIKPGNPPSIVTNDIIVRYSFPDNTYSVPGPGVAPGKQSKTNFWDYAEQLFGVKLQPNIGLTGKGLAGTMDKASDGSYFTAEGIPLTEIRDQDAATGKPYNFQKALITVADAASPNKVAASLTVVAPVSTELMCANCHSDTMDATTKYPIQPTGKTETNILAIHDYLNAHDPVTGEPFDNYAKFLAGNPDLLAKTPLIDNQPVLCASCHSSNALGTAGWGEIKSLSNAMHGHHNPTNAPDITPTTDGCYNCHPGPTTQCLRDTMSHNFAMGCVDCHGDITIVAQNTEPWLNEPQCSSNACHGPAYAPTEPANMPLYQKSTGHGGIYCEGCHDSTHAITPSRETNDGIKFVQLQGQTGSLKDCSLCHTAIDGRFVHTK